MALAHVIMTALLDQKQTGYDLARSFDSSLGFFWQASHQQIYLELRKLESKGWLNSEEITQTGKPNRIIYELTDEGHQALEQWVYTNTKARVTKDELFVKLYNLNQHNAPHIAKEIAKRKEDMMQSLELYERIRKKHYANPSELSLRKKGIYLVLKAGIEDGQLVVRWCDEVLAAITAY